MCTQLRCWWLSLESVLRVFVHIDSDKLITMVIIVINSNFYPGMLIQEEYFYYQRASLYVTILFAKVHPTLWIFIQMLSEVAVDSQRKLFFYHSLCSLYSWRYRNLGNLPHVLQHQDYQLANTGFAYDYQLIDVQDFNGVGESEPTPYFYQVSRSSF